MLLVQKIVSKIIYTLTDGLKLLSITKKTKQWT